jgi:hypothetical protein
MAGERASSGSDSLAAWIGVRCGLNLPVQSGQPPLALPLNLVLPSEPRDPREPGEVCRFGKGELELFHG